MDFFLLKTFLPLFIMTFGICLFIFLMQFLWKYIEDMVGKGIGIHVLAELFFYAATTFVPLVMPLAILFASLMTFGNLGEQFELLAMKASGISLMRIMRPPVIFLIFIAIATFFFQNNVIPVSQVKMYTLLYSVRAKSPELEIPESTFYTEIRGKNIYVKHKTKEFLKDVMIYDYSEGFNNARVIVADSGNLKTSTDKKFLIMTLFSGESFENVKGNKNRARDAKDPVPYRRETFDTMEMLIDFDGNFVMSDESIFQDKYIGKNLASLQHSIDSMTVRLDSINDGESRVLLAQSYKKTLNRPNFVPQHVEVGGGPSAEVPPEDLPQHIINFDSLFKAQEPTVKASLLGASKRSVENFQVNYFTKAAIYKYEDKQIRWHHTEMHKKFTLSFACLVFFFIGAPLGAIIRKGGLGTPAVISVLLFVFYYIIDSIGYKMARDAVWAPWQGMWLSSAVLLPMGVFLTYKAVNDSVILNAETYLDVFRRIIGKRELRKIEKKEVIMELPDYKEVAARLQALKTDCNDYFTTNRRWLSYFGFWREGGIDHDAAKIASELEEVVDILRNSDQILILNKTMDFPVINNYRLVDFTIDKRLGMTLAIIFPIGGLVYLIAIYRRKLLRADLRTTALVCDEIRKLF
ncbi:MAG: LptF/LptG family permease [Tannerella sp.]|jgi:lipopolysaccharide export system permease protein|nr:LptF/LptG family permease [Tannerella sp.]